MNTRISSKLAALGIALMLNSVLLFGMANLFDAPKPESLLVRSPDSRQLLEACRALADGGVSVVEITMSVPGALDVLRQVKLALGERVLLGAGTVLEWST